MLTGTGDYVIGVASNQVWEQVEVEGGMGSVLVTALLPGAQVEIESSTNNPVSVTSDDTTYAAFGELLTADYFPQTAWRFDYGINTKLVNTSGTMAGGTISGSFSRAQLFTSTNVSGTSIVQTNKFLRYLPGLGGLFRGTAVFASGTVNSEQALGIGDPQDALMFGYNGNTFGILVRRNGVDTWHVQSTWNGEALSEALVPQYGNIYQIRFQWLGYGLLRFYIFDKNKEKYVNVHTVKYPNTNPLTHILNPTLPILAYIKNKGNNTNLSMFTPSAVGGLEGSPSLGHINPMDVFNSFDTTVTFSDQNNNHLLSLRNGTTFNGVRNKIPVQIDSIQISGVGVSTVIGTVRIYKNGTTAGVLSFTPIDSTNSPVSSSTTTTTVTSSSAERTYTVVSNTNGLSLNLLDGELVLSPGDTLTIGIQDSSNVSTLWVTTIDWRELF